MPSVHSLLQCLGIVLFAYKKMVSRCPVAPVQKTLSNLISQAHSKGSSVDMKVFAPIVFLAALAAAAPSPQVISQCNTGSITCCNTLQSTQQSAIQSLLGLLGLGVGNVGAMIGLGCTSVSVVGIGNNGCTAQAACCTGNSFNGLISVGCSPINL